MLARALHRTRSLEALVTDIWIPPGFFTHHFPAKLRGRFHRDLADAIVVAPTVRSIASELWPRRSVGLGYEMVRRNQIFQERMEGKLKQLHLPVRERILFSYSYAAKHLFKFAKKQGWRTVLGQIDPGPKEERIVEGLMAGADPHRRTWEKADSRYWDNWHEEAELADRIIVNSEWSRSALVEEGISAGKIVVVPLSYEPAPRSESFERRYPASFDADRPLRVLFLGQLNLRKGAHVVLDVCRASRRLRLPIEFYLVGPQQIERPTDLTDDGSVHWVGPVPRNEVERHYKNADVFLFPTFSDGFGLTQLEAQSWALPVVSSRACGEVVTDGVNGRLLGTPSSEAVIDILSNFLKNPALLAEMSTLSRVEQKYSVKILAENIRKIQEDILS